MEQLQPQHNEVATPISDNKKRLRVDDSDSHSPESKLARADSGPIHDSVEPELDSENSGVDSPEAKRIQDELLSALEDPDEPPIQELDSVIKSFEEEILPVPADVTSFLDVALPDLGYLLEASDDELGLPPTFSAQKEGGDVGVLNGDNENELGVGYDSFELELGEGMRSYDESEEVGFVTLGGLFDYSDEAEALSAL